MAQVGFERFRSIVQVALDGHAAEVILEVGARDCTETLDFHSAYPDAAIFAFECNPATLPLCRRAVEGKSKIHLIEKAVTDQDRKSVV